MIIDHPPSVRLSADEHHLSAVPVGFVRQFLRDGLGRGGLIGALWGSTHLC